MIMEGRFHEQYDSTTTTTTQENVADSPLSGGDEATELEAYEPSPKKRRGANKRVVTIPIGSDGSRSKSEVYPPPDSWSWRKYGQKPIKGSPYPRGYYRCSSSKGCPARKQVERSHLDPTMLLITYSSDHNHPFPANTKYHHHHSATPAAASTSSSATTLPSKIPNEECTTFANQPKLEPSDNGFTELAGELGWLADVGCTLLDSPALLGPTWAQADLEMFMPIGEEDEFLFGDLGDLPESSVVFRRCSTETPCCGGTG